MIKDHWRRIAAIHCQDSDGKLAAVWLAFDGDTNVAHLYDCAVFANEVPAVIAEGMNARGRWIPVAWEAQAKPVMQMLLDRGVNMLPDPSDPTPAEIEVVSREIRQRMRTGQFRVDKRLAEWLDEYRAFYRQDAQVPTSSYPLMSATRLAVSQLEWARAQIPFGARRNIFPKVAIV
jgi:hypothetical protein